MLPPVSLRVSFLTLQPLPDSLSHAKSVGLVYRKLQTEPHPATTPALPC